MVDTGMRDFRSAFSIPEALERPSLVSNLADVRWQVRLGCQVQRSYRILLGDRDIICALAVFDVQSRKGDLRERFSPGTQTSICRSANIGQRIWEVRFSKSKSRDLAT